MPPPPSKTERHIAMHMSVGSMCMSVGWLVGHIVQWITVSAKFIGPSDRQDKYVIGPICLISSRTELSDVVSNTMYIMYTQSQTDRSSDL